MKKLWIIALVILFVVAIAFKLIYNKKQIEAATSTDPATQIIIPVKAVKPESARFQNKITVSGIINSWSDVTVMSENQGKIVKLFFETGKVVKEGELIAQLDDELVKSQYVLAEATYQKTQRDYSKYSGLAASDAVSNQQLEEIKLALKNAQTNLALTRKQMDNTSIKAPLSGIVTKRYVEKGTYLMPGTPVADIAEINRVKFVARVSEEDINSIFPGMSVLLDIPAIGKEKLNGKIYAIQSKADDARRYTIEVEVANTGGRIKAGMFGIAYLTGNKSVSNTLYIPRDCLNGSIKDPEVFLVKNNQAIRTSIKIGKVTDDKVEVLEGIASGDLVVQSGQINLDDSTKVSLIQ
jgi:RND family efflux transporter MFP subunit